MALGGSGDATVELFLRDVATIPEQYFALRHGEILRDGLGAVHLVATLFVDTPRGDGRDQLEAPGVASNVVIWNPRLADDLETFAEIEAADLDERVVDAVRERGLADRTQRIAQDLARTGPVLRSRADAEALAPGELATRIACGEHGDARVAEIVEILIGGSAYMPGPAPEAFARRAVGSSSVSTRHLIEAAFAEEPRGSDVMVYELGIVLWELAKGAESA
ncbi:hypothetical protein GCM10009592_04880 [Brachybacterium rhamnosum]